MRAPDKNPRIGSNYMTSILLAAAAFILVILACDSQAAPAVATTPASTARTARLALWLAKKGELLSHDTASYDLVMTSWFEPGEAQQLKARRPDTKLLAGLTLTWVLDDADWMTLLTTVANQGDPNGPLQVTEDMYLMFDDDGDGKLDRRCSPPGWEDIHAIDPRHPGWQDLILTFYDSISQQPQHDGVIVDMLDAYPFCQGAWSLDIPTPIDESGWISGQEQLLSQLRQRLPTGKWLLANAGRDLPEGSPFSKYLNGYLLENAFGNQFGLAGIEEVLASSHRALETTRPPHVVVYAVDTDDTGEIRWRRFRRGFAASLLMDHTYFAFDYGSRDHGGVADWWFENYYAPDLGAPLGPYALEDGVYRREFEEGLVVVASGRSAEIKLEGPHLNVLTQLEGTEFIVPKSDAGVFVRTPLPRP